jgi:hypothetical protein
MVSEVMVLLAPTVHISCVKIYTISKQTENELPLEPHNLGVSSGSSKNIFELMVHLAQTISKLMVRLAQTIHLSCTDTNTVSKQTEMRFQMTHVT